MNRILGRCAARCEFDKTGMRARLVPCLLFSLEMKLNERLFANQVFSSCFQLDKFVKFDREIDNVFLDILELIISKLSISFDFIKIRISNIEMEPIGDNYLRMVNFEIIT